MSIKAAIYDHLRNSTPIAAIVGTRIYPIVAPQGAALPYITFQRLHDEHNHHLGGAPGLVQAVFQINCWDDDDLGAEDLWAAVRNRFDGFRGQMGVNPNDVAVRGIHLENLDTFEPPTDASQPGIFGQLVTAEIWHAESVPTFT